MKSIGDGRNGVDDMARGQAKQGTAQITEPLTATMPSLVETQQRLLTEALAANTRIAIPFFRALFSPLMMATKTGIYYGPNPFMMMTGFSKSDDPR